MTGVEKITDRIAADAAKEAQATLGAAEVECRKLAEEYGNRTIMMHEGKIILDIDAETKKRIRVEDLLVMFEKASGSEINNDRMLLG